MHRIRRRSGLLAPALFAALILSAPASHAYAGLQALATCIRDSGAVFYGTYWCPSCERQLKRFGSAARLLPYVECANRGSRKQRSECSDAGVSRYPTWVLPDGSVETGSYSPESLAELTGCEAPSVFMP